MIKILLSIALIAGPGSRMGESGNRFDLGAFSGGPISVDTKIADDICLQFGDAPDYWLCYDSTDTRLELWSTNCASGTDCMLLRWEDGTDDAIFAAHLLGEIMTSDTATADNHIRAECSWPQATGANRNAADLALAGGLGTNQIVCADRTLADQDTVTFTVNYSGTTLVESTDFDCEGTASEEVCCDNLGTAITTAAIGIIPDCATTAGTCYLAFDETVLSFDMAVADGGVDGVFATLVEGTDGYVQSYGIFQIPQGTAVAPGMTFLGNGDTGIYRPFANSLGIATLSIARLIIDNTTATFNVNHNTTSYHSYSSTGIYELGGNMASTHSLGTGSVGCANQLEVDGVLYADSTVVVAGTSTKGASSTITTKTESVTFAANPGDASKATTGTILPDGAYVTGVTSRVTTAGTNCAGYRIGVSGGGDDDQFGEDLAVAATSTSDNSDWTATIANPVLTDSELVVTGTNGAGVPANCFDMVVALTVHYIVAGAATSN